MHTIKPKRIMITRPYQQAIPLHRKIQAAGYEPIIIPSLCIQSPRNTHPIRRLLTHFSQNDIWIFTSPNSILSLQDKALLYSDLPITTIAMGPGTAKAMREKGLRVDICPQGPHYCSETLLSLPILKNVKNKHIAILTGETGRNTLLKTLNKRGAFVNKIITYRTCSPPGLDQDLTQAFKQPIDMIISTSQSGLLNLLKSAHPHKHLLKQLLVTPLCVLSKRIKQLACEKRFQHVIVSPTATDNGIISALEEFYRGP